SCLFNEDLYILFFFSSRRRHTRFSRDWSSDVCSSDLVSGLFGKRGAQTSYNRNTVACSSSQILTCGHRFILCCFVMVIPCSGLRSEERRVGKECRCRRAPLM